MCGIAGITAREPEIVSAMVAEIRHRGPDDEGLWHDDRVTLGHCRLSILDLSERGHQPMTRRRGGDELVITYNGEAYDFAEVRAGLQQLGDAFVTGTDTEVILAAYARWGADAMRRFNGMWALALYDPARRKLVLSRDRFGKKPLYYRIDGGRLAFASEIKALLKVPGMPRRANPRVVSDYLYRGFNAHTDETFFEGIASFPASHTGEFDLDTGRLTLRRYFDLDVPERDVTPDEVSATLERAVRRRLIADVPVSLSLSGGLDSGAIAATLGAVADEPISVFSTSTEDEGQGGPGRKGDETHLVEEIVARHPVLRLHRSALSEERFVDRLPAMIWHLDEPFTPRIPYTRWEIGRSVKAGGRKVVLNGEGSDELLGGYWISLAYALVDLLHAGRWRRLLRELRSTSGTGERNAIVGGFLALALVPSPLLAAAQRRKAEGLRERFGVRVQPGDAAAQVRAMKGTDAKGMLRRLATEIVLPGLLLANDKMCMAHSVEARAPFLDREFAELAMAIPADRLVEDGLRKAPLRRAFRDRLPAAVVDRQSKDYFNAPTTRWLRSDRLAARVEELFGDARCAAFLDPAAVLREHRAFRERRARTDKAFLLRVVSLEEWLRVFDVAA